MNKIHIFAKLFLYILICFNASAANYYLAVDGNDQNKGTIDKPFATIKHANSILKAGDTLFIKGGHYKLATKDICRYDKSLFARVICFDKSGKEGALISYRSYKNERPIFDFTDVLPKDHRVYAFSVHGSWLHFKGIEVTGVQVTMKTHTQSICFENNGSHNIFERLIMRDGQAIGYYSTRGANNLVLNCDAYNNWDYTSEDGKGGNVDGFGIHPRKGDVGNVIDGCRAWFNSDDGYDLINSHETVVIKNSWAAYNGFTKTFKSAGDGNGFKAGGYGSTAQNRLPKTIPRHLIKNCFALQNKQSGFYANHHIGGCDWLNNSAFQNKRNYNMLSRTKDNSKDLPGYGHRLENNIGLLSRINDISNIDETKCSLKNNRFMLKKTDFISVDKNQFSKARQDDGTLPKITLMKLK